MNYNGKDTDIIYNPKMHKEINNANIFGKLLPEKKFRKNFITYIFSKSAGLLMIKSVVYIAGNCSELILSE